MPSVAASASQVSHKRAASAAALLVRMQEKNKKDYQEKGEIMQPRPRDERLVVDPRPGTRNRGTGRKVPMPVVDPRPRTGRKVPNPGLGTDDKVYRTMPITEKQLGAIKKMYGIK